MATEIRFSNEVSKKYPVTARRCGNNIVLGKSARVSITVLKAVMKRYYEMDEVAQFNTKDGKWFKVFSYRGDMSDSKMVEMRDWDCVIIGGCIDNVGDVIVGTELAKIPQDGTCYYI